MTIYGVIGNGPAKKGIIETALSDVVEAARAAKDEIEFLIAYTDESDAWPERVFGFLLDKDLWYEIVAPADLEDDEFVEGAQKRYKAMNAGAYAGVVSRLAKAENAVLLVLWEDDNEEIEAAITAAVEAGVEVKDLTNGLIPIDIADGEDGGDEEPEEEPTPAKRGRGKAKAETVDIKALGELGDEGDEAATDKLTELAETAGLDPDEYPTWSELAAALEPEPRLGLAAEKPKRGRATKAKVEDTPPEEDAPTGAHTREELESMHVRKLRSLALAEGWSASEMGKDEIIAKFLGEEPTSNGSGDVLVVIHFASGIHVQHTSYTAAKSFVDSVK